MGRILGIDYGKKRIGLALSDEGKAIAFESEIWLAEHFFQKIKDFLAEKNVEMIVLGYPLGMSGQHTQKTDEVKEFKKRLAEILPEIQIELSDERLSSQIAAGLRRAAGATRNAERNIDALSAQIILQNYLNKKEK